MRVSAPSAAATLPAPCLNALGISAQDFGSPVRHVIDRHGGIIDLAVLRAAFRKSEYLQLPSRAVHRFGKGSFRVIFCGLH